MTCLPKRLYLLRHAHAGWALPGQKDFDRHLDAQGLADARAIAMHAALTGYRPNRIVASAAQRCRETAAAMAGAFGLPVMENMALYNAPVSAYFDEIHAAEPEEPLLIVGHNPSIEELLATLVGPEASAGSIPDGYPTAGLAVLDRRDDSTTRPYRLVDFLQPPEH